MNTPRPPQKQLIEYLQKARQNMPVIATQEAFIGDRTRQTCTPTDAIAALNDAIHDLPIAISFELIEPPTYKRCTEQKKAYKSNDKIEVKVYRATVLIRFTITDGESDIYFDVVGQSNDYEGEASALKKAIMGAYKTFIELAFMARKGKNVQQSTHSNKQQPYAQARNEPPPNASTVQKVTPAPKAATPGKKAVEIGLVKQSNKPSKPTPPTLEVICQLLNQQFFDNDMLRESLEDFVHTKESLVWANAAMNIKLGNTPFKPNKDGGTLGAEAFESIRDQQINADAKKEALLGVFDMVNSYNFTCPQHIQLVASLLKLKQGKQESK